MTETPEPGAPVALVTGARRGIGRGIAVALAGAGFDLVVNDLPGDQAAETVAGVRAAGRRAATVFADIADLEASIRRLSEHGDDERTKLDAKSTLLELQ